jgi:hypothetical protein
LGVGLGFLRYKDYNSPTQDKNYSNHFEATIPKKITDELYNSKKL